MIVCDVNVNEGRDRAAAQTLEEDVGGGLEGPGGEVTVAVVGRP